MSNIEVIDKLLASGVITQCEYDDIHVRLSTNRSKILVSELLDGFDKWCDKSEYKRFTKIGYKVEATSLLKHVYNVTELSILNSIEFNGISLKDFNNHILHTTETQTTAMSFKRTKYGLIAFAKYLNEMNYANINIQKFISLDKFINDKQSINKVILTDDEVMRVSMCGDLRALICIQLCYEGLLKRNELYTIRIDDFDFNKNTLTLYNNVEINNNCIDNSYKNINRVVNISETLSLFITCYITELYDNINKWDKSRIENGKKPREDYGFLFQSVKTSIPSFSIIHNIFKNNAILYYTKLDGITDSERKSKIENFTIETVRNSRRVWLFKEGLDTNKIMLLAGDGNYHMCNKFKKYVSIIYPESLK